MLEGEEKKTGSELLSVLPYKLVILRDFKNEFGIHISVSYCLYKINLEHAPLNNIK